MRFLMHSNAKMEFLKKLFETRLDKCLEKMCGATMVPLSVIFPYYFVHIELWGIP